MIHSFIEGMAVGVQSTYANVIVISIGILMHKSVASISLAIKNVENNISINNNIKLIFFFSIASPIGILVGS